MLTPKQKDLLLLLHRWTRARGTAPSYDEMAAELGLRSKSGVHRLIAALEERGYILRLPGRARAVQVVRMPDDHAQEGAQAQESAALALMGAISVEAPGGPMADTGQRICVPAAMLAAPGVLRAEACYALRMEGAGAPAAGIHAGDIVVMCRCTSAPDGATAALTIDGRGPILRAVHNHGASIVIHTPGAPDAKEHVSVERARVAGRLIGLIRLYS